MTLPFMNWDDVTPDDVVETVVMPDQLGTALQDQSEAKYKAQSADRFPGYIDGTLAGGPLAAGPLGMVNGMFGKFVSQVANADPATIEKPKDLQPLVPGFFDLPLQDFVRGIEQLLSGVIPIGLLSPTVPNLLANGAFDGAQSMVEGEGWTWDAVEGRTSPGCALFTAAGLAGVQLSTPVQVAEGQEIDASVWVRRDGLAASAGAGVRATLRWYSGESLVSTTEVGALLGGGTHDWARISVDGVTTPAGVDTVCLALVVDAEVTAGSVWFDDASLIKPATSLPQQWVSGLVDALDSLGDWIEHLVDTALTSLGLPTLGGLGDRILDFADALGDMLGLGEDNAAGLDTLLGNLLSNPASVIGAIPQTLVSGLQAALSNMTGHLQDLIDALLRAIRKVPVVGGSLADIIAEVGGLNDRADQAKSAADGVQAGIVEGWAGGSTSGADQDVFDTMSAIKALVGGDGYTRVNVTASGLWTKPAGTTEVIVVGIAAGQNGGAGSVYDGGNGGRGGGHKVQALDPAAFSAIHVEVGSNGAPTRFRANSSGGGLLMEAIVGSIGAMATQFGYAPSNSQAGGGGGGGAGGGSGNEGSSGTGTGGGVDGSATVGGPGGSGGPSAGASGGSTSGGAGGSVSMSGIPSGGGGGGGGKGGSGSIGAGGGGAGGPGGFPGGGGGGGGGKGSGIGGSTGAGGAGGAGFGIIFYR